MAAALVALAFTGCDPLWRSPWRFEDHDAAEPTVARLLALAARPERASQGFAPLPVSGRVSVGKNKLLRTPPPGWEQVTTSIHIQAPRVTKAWYFGGGSAAPVFLCETERYHSPQLVTSPTFNEGREFYEYVDLEFATVASRMWEPGFRVNHFGPRGRELATLEEAKALGLQWGALRPERE